MKIFSTQDAQNAIGQTVEWDELNMHKPGFIVKSTGCLQEVAGAKVCIDDRWVDRFSLWNFRVAAPAPILAM